MATTYEVAPLSEHLGARIDGVDLRETIDDAFASELRDLLDRHKVLVFRDQEIAVADQMRVVKVFHPLYDELEDGTNYYFFDDAKLDDPRDLSFTRSGRTLHADFMWTRHPLPVISLYGVDCTDLSGATRFSDATLAVQGLTASQRARFASLRAVHARYDLSPLARASSSVVTEHPRTGLPTLYMSEVFTKEIEGVSEDESSELLDQCFSLLRSEHLTLDHHWRKGDLVLWDNQALMHGRMPSIDVSPRILRRVSGHDRTFAEMLPDDASREAYCSSMLKVAEPGSETIDVG